jgi:DNA-binding PadR family transcriptional regulator
MPKKPSRPEASADGRELNATAASVLGFLAHKPLSGFELARDMQEIMGDFWNVTRSQIYRELKDLEARGYVEEMEAGARDKRPYRITKQGRRAFEAAVAESPGPPILRFPLVWSAFFGEHLAPETMARFVAEQRAYHASRLAAYEEFERRAAKGTWAHESLRMGLAFQRAVLRWIDTIPKRLLGGRLAK